MDDSINFDKLDKQLQNLVLEEKLYWEKNDAKLRAVEQRVGTYEEFRQMVLGAHLKPLNKDEKITDFNRGHCRWNSISESKSPTLLKQESSSNVKIENVSHFMTFWKKSEQQDLRFNLLLQTGPKELKRFFMSDLRFDFFDEAMIALSANEVSPGVIEILEALSLCRGFKLVVDFMSTKAKECCKSLFSQISPTDSEVASKLTKLYLPNFGK